MWLQAAYVGQRVATNVSALRADLNDHHPGPKLMVSRMRGPGNPEGKTASWGGKTGDFWVLCEGQSTTCPLCKLGLVRAESDSSLRCRLLQWPQAIVICYRARYRIHG